MDGATIEAALLDAGIDEDLAASLADELLEDWDEDGYSSDATEDGLDGAEDALGFEFDGAALELNIKLDHCFLGRRIA